MNCEEFGNALYGYMEHRIAAGERVAVESHRDLCPQCADLFRVAHEITCRELADFLDDYVENRLDAERRAVFERHLSVCTDCVSYADTYRRTLRMAGDCAGAAPPVPPELKAAILAARGKDVKPPS